MGVARLCLYCTTGRAIEGLSCRLCHRAPMASCGQRDTCLLSPHYIQHICSAAPKATCAHQPPCATLQRLFSWLDMNVYSRSWLQDFSTTIDASFPSTFLGYAYSSQRYT